jgi:addiction module RelE/StbE family toxin
VRLIWREEARSGLRAIITYIAQRNPAAASDLKERIEFCAERLVDHPFMYRRGRVQGTREAVVHPNYIVVYRVTEDAIEILTVLHSRQQYPPAS